MIEHFGPLHFHGSVVAVDDAHGDLGAEVAHVLLERSIADQRAGARDLWFPLLLVGVIVVAFEVQHLAPCARVSPRSHEHGLCLSANHGKVLVRFAVGQPRLRGGFAICCARCVRDCGFTWVLQQTTDLLVSLAHHDDVTRIALDLVVVSSAAVVVLRTFCDVRAIPQVSEKRKCCPPQDKHSAPRGPSALAPATTEWGLSSRGAPLAERLRIRPSRLPMIPRLNHLGRWTPRNPSHNKC